jgi:hypothetical protein
MDGLPQLLGPLISGGSAVGGTVGNIFEDVKRNQYQDFVMNLIKNPQALAALVQKIQQPLNNGLTQAVGNQVQGNLAERGLSQAPGIFAASESQALAPFYQQNQNTATQAILSALGLPAGSFGQPINTSGAWQGFLKSLPPGSNNGNWNGQFGVGGIVDPSLGSISAMPGGYGGTVGPDPTAPIYDPSWGS